MPPTTVPGPLRLKLGEVATEGLEQMFAQHDVLVAERFDLRLLETKLEIRSDLTQGLAQLRVEMERTRTEVITWNLAFWVGQFAALLGALALMLPR